MAGGCVMTVLSVYDDSEGTLPPLTTTDPAEIAARLRTAGIGFERWDTASEISSGDPPERILAEYDHWLTDLKRRGGYKSADVISLTPDHPQRAALRQKFLDEHTHAEDEVRFFVAGRGAFYLHIDGRVLAVTCERGDLLRVPAGTKHWFDMGPAPSLTAIRVFTNPEGWVAQFTGDGIADRFPRLEPGGLPLG
jgi:1,2-dihydroxy-3-keto-5-methylthiopentene dioxygenase